MNKQHQKVAAAVKAVAAVAAAAAVSEGNETNGKNGSVRNKSFNWPSLYKEN
jgi:hypothetical protein